MSWLRLDDGFAEHPKIASLTDRELRIWMRTLCYCARQQDPSIDSLAIKEVRGLTPTLVSKLEGLSLLDRVGITHEIHDWIAYQPKDKTGAERQARYRARRHGQATSARDDTVTPTVTPDRYENVTSRAREPDQTSPVRPEDLTTSRSEVPRPIGDFNGLDTKSELLLARLLDWIGDDADERTAAVVRHTLSQASEAAVVELEESLPTAKPRHRAKYVVGTLKVATARAKTVVPLSAEEARA
jgi:hypothetical protein